MQPACRANWPRVCACARRHAPPPRSQPAKPANHRSAPTSWQMTTDPDHVALTKCMRLAMQDPPTRVQLESMLQDRDWFSVARTACDHVQVESLNLKPWMQPPCVVSADGVEQDQAAQNLLRKMLAAGISRYTPNPMAALKA